MRIGMKSSLPFLPILNIARVDLLHLFIYRLLENITKSKQIWNIVSNVWIVRLDNHERYQCKNTSIWIHTNKFMQFKLFPLAQSK